MKPETLALIEAELNGVRGARREGVSRGGVGVCVGGEIRDMIEQVTGEKIADGQIVVVLIDQAAPDGGVERMLGTALRVWGMERCVQGVMRVCERVGYVLSGELVKAGVEFEGGWGGGIVLRKGDEDKRIADGRTARIVVGDVGRWMRFGKWMGEILGKLRG